MNRSGLFLLFLIFSFCLLTFSGCGPPIQEKVTSIEPVDADATSSSDDSSFKNNQTEGTGYRIRVKMFTRDPGIMFANDNEIKMMKELEDFINSGQYDIRSVKTIYDNNCYLYRAEVYYFEPSTDAP